MLLSYLGNTFLCKKTHIKHDIHVRKVAVRERKWEIEGASYIIKVLSIWIINKGV